MHKLQSDGGAAVSSVHQDIRQPERVQDVAVRISELRDAVYRPRQCIGAAEAGAIDRVDAKVLRQALGDGFDQQRVARRTVDQDDRRAASAGP